MYQDSESTLESLLAEKERLNQRIASLREEKTTNRTYQQPSYEVNEYNMNNNNKKVMKEALRKALIITFLSTVGLTFLGSIFITTLIPLIMGSALISAGAVIPISLIEAARKMANYDRQYSSRPQYNNNMRNAEITNEINEISQRLREIEREIRVRTESSNQASFAPDTYRVVYPSQAYERPVRLYNQPQQVRITIEEGYRR